MRLSLFLIKSQPGVAYKRAFLKKACNIAFQSSKNEEITLSYEFIFVFIWYFNEAIFSEKFFQMRGVFKKNCCTSTC